MILVLNIPDAPLCKRHCSGCAITVWLEDRHIVEQNPTQQEPTEWCHKRPAA